MKSGSRIVVLLLGVGTALTLVLALVPIYQSTGDSTHGCGNLIRKDSRYLRREFCEAAGAYDRRIRLVVVAAGVAVAGAGVVLLISGQTERRSRQRGKST